MGKLKSDILKLLSFGLIFTSLLTSINPTEVKALGYKDNSIDTLEEGDILKAGETYTISKTTQTPKFAETASDDYINKYDGSKFVTDGLKDRCKIILRNEQDYTGVAGNFYNSYIYQGSKGKPYSSNIYLTTGGALNFTLPDDDKYNFMVTSMYTEKYDVTHVNSESQTDYDSANKGWVTVKDTRPTEWNASKPYYFTVDAIEDKQTGHRFITAVGYRQSPQYNWVDLDMNDVEISTVTDDEGNECISKLYVPSIGWALYFKKYYTGDIDTSGSEQVIQYSDTASIMIRDSLGFHTDGYTYLDANNDEVKNELLSIELTKIPKETILNTTLDANQVFEGGKTYQFFYLENTSESGDTDPTSKLTDKYAIDKQDNILHILGSASYGGVKVMFDEDAESYKNLTIRNEFGSSYLYYKNTCEIGIDQYNNQGTFTQQNSYSWSDFAKKMGGTSNLAVVNTITFPEGHNWRYTGNSFREDDFDEYSSGDKLRHSTEMVIHFSSDATQCDVVYRSKRTGEDLYEKTLNVDDSIELTDADKQAQPKLNDYITTEYYSDIDDTEQMTDLKAKGYKMYVYIPDNKCYVTVSSPRTYTSTEDELLADSTLFKAWVKRGSALDINNITFLKEVWDQDVEDYVDKEMPASDIQDLKDEYDLTKLYTSDMKEYDTSNIQTDNLSLFAATKAVEVKYYTVDSAYKSDSGLSLGSSYFGYANVNRDSSMLVSDVVLRDSQGEISQDKIRNLKDKYDTTKLYDESLNLISGVIDIPIYLTQQTVYLAPKDKSFTVTFLDSERNESYNYDTIYEKQVKWGESGELTDTDKEQCTELESFNTTKYYDRYSGNNTVDISKVYHNTTVYLRRVKFRVRYIDYDTKDIIDTKQIKKGDSARIDFKQSPFNKYIDSYFDKYGYRTTPNSLDGISGNMDIYLKKTSRKPKIKIEILNKDGTPCTDYIRYVECPSGNIHMYKTSENTFESDYLYDSSYYFNLNTYSGSTCYGLYVDVSSDTATCSKRDGLDRYFESSEFSGVEDGVITVKLVPKKVKFTVINEYYHVDAATNSRILDDSTSDNGYVYYSTRLLLTGTPRDGYLPADTKYKAIPEITTALYSSDDKYTFVWLKAATRSDANLAVVVKDYNGYTCKKDVKIIDKTDANTVYESKSDRDNYVAEFENVTAGEYNMFIDGEDVGSITMADRKSDRSVSKEADTDKFVITGTENSTDELFVVNAKQKDYDLTVQYVYNDIYHNNNEYTETMDTRHIAYGDNYSIRKEYNAKYGYTYVKAEDSNGNSTDETTIDGIATGDTVVKFYYTNQGYVALKLNVTDKDGNAMDNLDIKVDDNTVTSTGTAGQYEVQSINNGRHTIVINGSTIGTAITDTNSYTRLFVEAEPRGYFKEVSQFYDYSSLTVNLTQTTGKIKVVDRYDDTDHVRSEETYGLGDTYSFDALSIDGYKVTGDSVQTGILDSEDGKEIVFNYTKKSTTATPDPDPTPTPTPSPSPDPTPTPTPSPTPGPTPTPTPTPSPDPTPTPGPTPSPDPTPTPGPTPSPDPTPSNPEVKKVTITVIDSYNGEDHVRTVDTYDEGTRWMYDAIDIEGYTVFGDSEKEGFALADTTVTFNYMKDDGDNLIDITPKPSPEDKDTLDKKPVTPNKDKITDKPTKTVKQTVSTLAPKTGDTSEIYVYILLCLVGLVIMFGALAMREDKRKKKKN